MNEEHNKVIRKFAGAWRLVTSEFRTASGDVMYPLGEDAFGQAIFTESGYISAQLMRLSRPRFASNNQAHGTPQEIEQSFQGYVAYCGQCELDLEKQTITTHVEGSMYPNWVGGEQIRFYEFNDDELILRTPPIAMGEETITGVLTWQRL